MKSKIIQVYKGQVFVGTWTIAEALDTYHSILKSMIRKHREAFLKFGDIIPLYTKTYKKGGQIHQFLLNAQQTRLMISLLQNASIKVWEVQEKSINELDFFESLEDYFRMGKKWIKI